MSLKAELETWTAALKAYDDQEFEKSLQLFQNIADSSKIFTNIGLIHATLGEHELAVANFNSATALDQYLAIAYFQCGVSNFLLGRYELALKDFEEAFLYLRGNQDINYEQLGLKFKLHSAEILFNKALCHIYLGEEYVGLRAMEEARKDKAIADHDVIDEAIRDRGDGYTVFSIPVGVLYRPPENKVKNSKTKDYLGKAKLVATSDANDVYTSFTGATRLGQGLTPSGAPIDSSRRRARDDSPSGRSSPAPTAATSRSAPTNARPSSAGSGGQSSSPARFGLKASASISNLRARLRNKPEPPVPPQRTSFPGPLEPPAPLDRRSEDVRPPARPVIQTNYAQSPARRSPNTSPATGIGASATREYPPQRDYPQQSRLTEIYSDYMDDYANEEPPPVPKSTALRKAIEAQKSLPNVPTSRGMSVKSPPDSTATSISNGGAMRRQLSKKAGYARSTAWSGNDGYQETEYGDGPFELIKIRIKLHYNNEVRGMATAPDMTFEEFLERVTSKFGKSFGSLHLQFKDEDGGKVSLRDDSDYELAIETAKESANGKPEGKLEIWCTDE